MTAGPPAAPGAPREGRIDIVRGLAILVILVNHLSQGAEFGHVERWLIPTPSRYGYSTAAELFVMLSGYMVGLVYLRRPRPGRTVWRRAAKLWLYNLGLLALVLPLVTVMTPAEAEFWRLDAFQKDGWSAFVDFVTLQSAPRLLDVLVLYILLMLVTPLAIVIERRSWWALVSLSIGLYVAAQAVTIYRLETIAGAAKDGIWDRLSWQMLFYVPMALGVRRAHVPLFRWLEGRWGVLLALVGAFVALAALRQLQIDGTVPTPRWLEPRFGLTVQRVAHSLLVLLLYLSALTMAGRATARAPLSLVGMIGRHSLDCFAFGVVLIYALSTGWLHFGGGLAGYYAEVVVAVTATTLLAWWRDGARAQMTVPASNPLPAR